MSVLNQVLKSLLEYEKSDKYSNLVLNSKSLDSLSKEERGLFTLIFYSVIEHKITLDYYIGVISKRQTGEISPRALLILRIGAAELLYINSIPDYAAVNECVSLAKSAGERAFINGVLRTLVREKGNLPLPDKNKSIYRYLSVKYSVSREILKLLSAAVGEEGLEDYLSAISSLNYTDISVNLKKTTREAYLEILLSGGYAAKKSSYSSLGIRIEGSVNPSELPYYSEGYFFVQDEASALLADVAGVSENMRAVDVCSAPGGKSLALASLSRDTAEIYAFDLRESKLSLIESSKKRLGFEKITVGHLDATKPKAELFSSFDVVLCDVPCSGLGILSKKADMRYKDISGLDELPSLQYEILNKSKDYLKNGGTLIYSTCTVNPLENGGVIDRFLLENPEYEKVPFEIGTLKTDGALTLYPNIHKTDGFFICKLRRKANG